MEITFYDRTGKPIAYTEDEQHIYLFSGRPVAHLNNDSVYSFSGIHLGWFDRDWIYDNNGKRVFFTPEASGIKPVRSVKPVKSVKSVKPVKGVKNSRPARPVRSSSWSSLSGEQFFQ